MMDEIEALSGRHWVLDGHRAVRSTLHEWGMFDTPDAALRALAAKLRVMAG
jgi:hypothetical protein